MEKTINVLLIEENPEDVLIFKKKIANLNFCRMEHAETISIAINKLDEQNFDIIILDLNLPDSTGLKTLDQIRKLDDDIPIIILTGANDEKLALQAIKGGAQDYIDKNQLDFQIISKTIAYSIERHRLMIELKEREKKINDLYIELEFRNKQLLELSIKDPLTNLYNRRFLDENLLIEFNKSIRYRYPLFFLICDIDFFKNINDNYGHKVGDKVLIEVARILQDSIRTADICGRYGGDEFSIFGHLDYNAAQILLKRILKKFRSFKIEQMELSLTLSIGICLLDDQFNSMEELMKKADDALYKSKEKGRDRGHIFHNGDFHEFNEV